MLSGSGWRPSEEVKDALPEVGAGGPVESPWGPSEELRGPVESPCGGSG